MLKESVRKPISSIFQAYQSPARGRIYTSASGIRLKTPTRQRISSLEYNILMNTPGIDNQTLTSKLFHCTQKDESCLFRFQQTNRKSKILFRALCPNIYFQKLRIVYFLLLTQSYQPLYKNEGQSSTKSQSLLSSINSTSSISLSQKYQNTEKQYIQRNCNENQFKKALDILRQMFYEYPSACKIKQKYLAQFFQFLQFDHQQYMRNQKQRDGQNIVVNIMNKYPIMDEIFIDMLIMFIEKSASKRGGLNIDDNFNIKQFLESLQIQAIFISNWQFILETIRVTIGIDTFSLDYDSQSFFTDIVQTLDLNEKKNGLDVSNVGGFDEQVFKKLDTSYIHDLNEVMSNCSESRVELQGYENQGNVKAEGERKGEKNQIRIDYNKMITKTSSFYHPINIIKIENPNKTSELTIGGFNHTARINNSRNGQKKEDKNKTGQQKVQGTSVGNKQQPEERKVIAFNRDNKVQGMFDKILKKPQSQLIQAKKKQKPSQIIYLSKKNIDNSEGLCATQNIKINTGNEGFIQKNQGINSNKAIPKTSTNIYTINTVNRIGTPTSNHKYQYLSSHTRPNPQQSTLERNIQIEAMTKFSSQEKSGLNMNKKTKNEKDHISVDTKQVIKKQTNPEQSNKDYKKVSNIQSSIKVEGQKKLYQRQNQTIIYGLFKTDNTKSLPGNSLPSEANLSQKIKPPTEKSIQPKFKVYYETSGQKFEAFKDNDGQSIKIQKNNQKIIPPVKITQLHNGFKRQQINEDLAKKQLLGTSAKQSNKIQENKKLINQLYEQFVVKKSFNGDDEQRKRFYSTNVYNNEEGNQKEKNQQTKRSEMRDKYNNAINRKIIDGSSNPDYINLNKCNNYSVGKSTEDQSINQVCNNINEMLSNIKIALQKNDKKSLNPIDLNNKTEGQQMWEKHKLKNSSDPKSLRGLEEKVQQSTQLIPSGYQLQSINTTPPTLPINFQQRVVSPINQNQNYLLINNGTNNHNYNQTNLNSLNYAQNIPVKSGVKFINNDIIRTNYESEKKAKQQRTFALNIGQLKTNELNRNVPNQPQLEKVDHTNSHQISQNQNYRQKRTYNIQMHKYQSSTNPIRYVGASHQSYNRVENQNIPDRIQYEERKFQTSHLVFPHQSRTPSHYFNNGSSFNNWLKK